MKENNLKIVLEALAEKIDVLSRDVYFSKLEADSLRSDNAKLKVENEKLKKDNETLCEALDALKELITEEIRDGIV